MDGHLWWTDKRNWGYRTYFSREALNAKYSEVVGNLVGPRALGLAAAVYTQTTDVEGEVNGLMTYDRELVKFDKESVNALHDRIYSAEGTASILLATSEHAPQEWQYRTSAPGPDWSASDDGDGWESGAAPFQSGSNPMFPIGTRWRRPDLDAEDVRDRDPSPKSLDRGLPCR